MFLKLFIFGYFVLELLLFVEKSRLDPSNVVLMLVFKLFEEGILGLVDRLLEVFGLFGESFLDLIVKHLTLDLLQLGFGLLKSVYQSEKGFVCRVAKLGKGRKRLAIALLCERESTLCCATAGERAQRASIIEKIYLITRYFVGFLLLSVET